MGLVKYDLFMWSKLNFHHHYSSLQCHMIFRNHNNMLIAAQETFLIIMNVENCCAASYFLWKMWYLSVLGKIKKYTLIFN